MRFVIKNFFKWRGELPLVHIVKNRLVSFNMDERKLVPPFEKRFLLLISVVCLFLSVGVLFADDGGRAVYLEKLRAARSLLREGESVKAQELLLPLTGRILVEDELKAEAWMIFADVYAARDNWSGVLSAVEQAERLDTAKRWRPNIQDLRLAALIKLGKVETGLAAAHAWIVANIRRPEAAVLQLRLADRLLANEMYELAEKEYQSYLDAFADSRSESTALLGKGWSLWFMARYAEAAMAFERAFYRAEVPREKKEALWKAADSFFAAGRYKTARDYYETLLKTNLNLTPVEQSQVGYQIAESWGRIGNYRAAEEGFTPIVNGLVPGLNEWLAERAGLRLAHWAREVNPAKAVGIYDHLLKVSTNNVMRAAAQLGRGMAYWWQKDYQRALVDFSALTSTDEEVAGITELAFYFRCWCYYSLNQNAAAVQSFRRFVDLYPTGQLRAAALFWLGSYALQKGNYVAAEECFLRLVNSGPESPVVARSLYMAAWSAYKQRKYWQAIEYYNQIARDYEYNSDLMALTRFAQGEALRALGEYPAAVLAFEEVIKNYPASFLVPAALGRKGDCQFMLGMRDKRRYREALASYKSLLGEPTLQLGARYKRGRCYEEQGLIAEALEEYLQGIDDYLAGTKTLESRLWFARSALRAAAIKEERKEWVDAVYIYQCLVDANLPFAAQIRSRLALIGRTHGSEFE